MAGVILVVLDRPDTAPGLLAAAGCLAELTGQARIKALVADPSLRRLVEDWAVRSEQPAPAGDAIDTGGRLAETVEQRGRRADVIVIAQPREDDARPTREALRRAVFQTERPILVVPPGWTAPFGRRAVIAWRDDERAIKAVIPALRLLGHAAAVHLITGVRAGDPAGSANPAAIPAVLTDHGIDAMLHVVPIGPAPFGQTLLETVQALDADMLVMGAYGHTRLHDLILGGLTRYVLGHATIPTFMRH